MSDDRFDRRRFLARGTGLAAGAGLAAVGLPLVLAGCSSTGNTPARTGQPGVSRQPPRRGGAVTVGMSSEIDGFLPTTNHFDNTGLTYANTVFDSLTAIARDGSWRPNLAQAVTSNPDQTVWTITLRPNVVFHDGTALDASVVVANLQALRQSPLTGQALQPIADVRATGPLTVQVTTSVPLVSLPYALSTQVGYVVARAQLERQDTTHPIGTGPFQYQSWQPDDHFTAVRNPHYWRPGLPYLDAITYKPIVADTSREQALRSGSVDVMVTRDPQAIVDLRSQPAFAQVTDLGRSTGEPDMDFIVLNTAVPPLDDLTVRQALAYALDTDTLSKLFGAGIAKPATSPFPPGSPFRAPDNGYPHFDLATARQLVAQAKPRHGGTLAVELGTITDPRLARLIQAIQQMWEQAGFQVRLTQVQQTTFISNLVTGNFQAYTDEQFAAPDPDLNYVWWSSTTAAPPGQVALNFSRNRDPQLEQTLERARSTTDPAARAAAYQQVDRLLAADLPYLWLGQATWSMTANSFVQNFDNPVLPDGTPGQGFTAGVFDPTPMWLAPR